MRALCFILLALFAFPLQALELPGLEQEAARYRAELRERHPGSSPQSRAAAEGRAARAERQNNLAAAIAAREESLAAGWHSAEAWLALTRLHLSKRPPDAARAVQAAWTAFTASPAGAAEVPALLALADALKALDRPIPMLEALAAAADRVPEDAAVQARLATARAEVGMRVARLRSEAEAEPARVCVSFTLPLARRQDWTPADWLRTDPPLPDVAVIREGDELCVAGLPWGRTTRLILRAGLPGEGDNRLRRDESFPVAMPNRMPRLAFSQRDHILPRGQEARVTLGSVNVSSVRMRLIRLAERNLIGFRNQWQPGQSLEPYLADYLAEETGTVLWEGRADIPSFEMNRGMQTALPLPDILRHAPPGLFVLAVRSGDGNAARDAMAALPLIITDIGLVAWRGADGVAVQARSLGTALAKPGVRIALVARNNELLAEAETDETGLVRFAAPLLRGSAGLAPVALHAVDGSDFATLDLEAASFDLSDRGAAGRPHPGALDAFVWLDRGIYRPGETVHITALLRDGAGAPIDLPVRFRVRRPNSQVFAELVPDRTVGAAVQWSLPLSNGAPAGAWTIEAFADPAAPPIGRARFRVDAFVPERLEVTATPPPGAQLVPGQNLSVPVVARFLYGAPGAGLEATAEMTLSAHPEPFAAWRGWRIGLVDEAFAPALQTFQLPPTDAEGSTTLALTLPRAPDTTKILQAEVAITVSDPGGAESRTRFSVPIRPAGRMTAIRPVFQGESVDDNAEAAFEIAALTPQGEATAARLQVRLLRERPNWRVVTRGSVARYETVWRDEVVDSAEVDVAPGAPAKFARTLPFGRYRLEAIDPAGLGITSMRFRAGWTASESAETPDRVDLAADRQSYSEGEVARVRVTPPFSGRASVAVLTDRLVALQEVDVSEAGTEIEVPVSASWGPGAYIAVSLYRPGETRRGPARALGLVWLSLDPAPRRLDVVIEAPSQIMPRRQLEVPVRVGNAGSSARLTLAAVDEGILRLTNFAAPDPVAHFLGRRRLGTDIRDDYGRLIQPAEGEAAALRQGGDEDDPSGFLRIPQRIVSLFSGVVATDTEGVARVPLEIPDFAGELRLMAVAWDGRRIGSATRAVTVRDPLVAEAVLPRFLAPGDDAVIPILLHNLDLPSGQVTATVTTEGAVAVTGPATVTATLAAGARTSATVALQATAAGEGVLHLAVSGPGGFLVTRSSHITVRSSRPSVTVSSTVTLPPGQEATLAVPAEAFVPGSWRSSVSLGSPVRYDAAALRRALEDYPLACTEQVGSLALALAFAADDPERAGALQRAVEMLVDRQRYDGSFGLWSAQGEMDPWLSPFVLEVLLRARARGAAVPDAAIDTALAHIDELLDDTVEDTAQDRADQAYRVHVLSLAGRHRLGAARRLFDGIEQLPTPLARAQLASAFARAGDRQRAEAAFAAALSAPVRAWWTHDFGSQLRDALAVAFLLKESGLLQDRLPPLLARLPAQLTPHATSTQEQGWAVAAAGILSQGNRAIEATLNGARLPAQPFVTVAAPPGSTLRNLSAVPLQQTVSVTGLPVQSPPAARSGMRVQRLFLNLDGSPLNLDQLSVGAAFVVLLETRLDSTEEHRVMVQQGLPAGWEITARLGPGSVPGLPWLDALSETEAQPALDDRFAATATLSRQSPVLRVAFRARATTAGRFELPGAEAGDMYRPAFFARQNTGHIVIAPRP